MAELEIKQWQLYEVEKFGRLAAATQGIIKIITL